MSTTREVTVWCDSPDCSEWTAYGESTAARARRTAKRFGWTFRGGRDLCPGCSTGRENGSES